MSALYCLASFLDVFYYYNSQPYSSKISPMLEKPKNVSIKLGWIFVGSLIVVLFAFGSKRLFNNFWGMPTDELSELKYLEHPIVTSVHMLSGLFYILLAPLQFSKKTRYKNIGLHRKLGRFLVICALISGIYGIVTAIVLPVIGGLASETAGWFFGPLFIISLTRAYWCVRNKNIAEHREWMIRTFAIGLAVGTQRLLLVFFIASTDYSFTESFGPTLWLGFSINLLIAEIWINLTKPKKIS